MNEVYNDCTLFELYEMVHCNSKIECPMTCETLAIQAEKANIMPKDLEVSQPPIWIPEKGRYDDYCICIQDEHANSIFRIMPGDIIIMPDGVRCAINDIYFDDKDDVDAGIHYIEDDDVARDILVVSLIDLEKEEDFTMKAWDFLMTLDCEDIVYEASKWLSYVNKE